MNGLTTITGAPYIGVLTKARDNENTRVIEVRTLDGSYIVQTVGNAATEVDIEFFCDMEELRILRACASSATPIVATWEDRAWTGTIKGGDIKWDYSSPIELKLTFVLLVTGSSEVEYPDYVTPPPIEEPPVE
jgi:hypothetical protein